MKRKQNVGALLRKLVGKDSAAILRMIDGMLKRGVPRAKIEKALAVELAAHIKHVDDLIVKVHHSPGG